MRRRGVSLLCEERRGRMDKHSLVAALLRLTRLRETWLFEVLDRSSFGIKCHGAGHRGRVLGVWELDAGDLRTERGGYEGAEKC